MQDFYLIRRIRLKKAANLFSQITNGIFQTVEMVKSCLDMFKPDKTRITAPLENCTISNQLMGKRQWFICLQFRTAGENSGSRIVNANTQFERQFELYNETIQSNQFMYIQHTL